MVSHPEIGINIADSSKPPSHSEKKRYNKRCREHEEEEDAFSSSREALKSPERKKCEKTTNKDEDNVTAMCSGSGDKLCCSCCPHHIDGASMVTASPLPSPPRTPERKKSKTTATNEQIISLHDFRSEDITCSPLSAELMDLVCQPTHLRMQGKTTEHDEDLREKERFRQSYYSHMNNHHHYQQQQHHPRSGTSFRLLELYDQHDIAQAANNSSSSFAIQQYRQINSHRAMGEIPPLPLTPAHLAMGPPPPSDSVVDVSTRTIANLSAYTEAHAVLLGREQQQQQTVTAIRLEDHQEETMPGRYRI